jgi:hypothetical protein
VDDIVYLFLVNDEWYGEVEGRFGKIAKDKIGLIKYCGPIEVCYLDHAWID